MASFDASSTRSSSTAPPKVLTHDNPQFPQIDLKSWEGKSGSLSEIYSSGFQFSWVSPDYEIAHQFVMCKDFLHDAVFSFLNGKAISIYGFKFSKSNNNAISLNRARIAVRDQTKKGPEFAQQMANVQMFMNHLEDEYGFDNSIVFKVKGREGLYLVEADKRWMTAPALVSLFALMLRIGRYYTGDLTTTIQNAMQHGNDRGYVSAIYPRLDDFLRHYQKMFDLNNVKVNFDQTSGSTDIDYYHDSGIVSLLSERRSNYVAKLVCNLETAKATNEAPAVIAEAEIKPTAVKKEAVAAK